MRKKQNNAILNSVEVKVEVGVELGKKNMPMPKLYTAPAQFRLCGIFFEAFSMVLRV